MKKKIFISLAVAMSTISISNAQIVLTHREPNRQQIDNAFVGALKTGWNWVKTHMGFNTVNIQMSGGGGW